MAEQPLPALCSVPTISERLALLGYSHRSVGYGYKHHITAPNGENIGAMSAGEAVEYLEAING